MTAPEIRTDHFVGRDREMSELAGALDGASEGRGRLVTIVGDPGVGKTRLVQEFSEYAIKSQVQVVWGRCYEERGAPPYCPWRQAINAHSDLLDDDTLIARLGSGGPEIAEIASSIANRFPSLEAPPTLDPSHARFRLFESITALLKNASLDQPLLLILDDFQWADRPSLLMLEYLSKEIAGSQILVVVLYRDIELSRRDPFTSTLSELVKTPMFQRIRLRGLKRADVSHILENSAGVEPPDELVEAIYVQTEGNALFVTEIVRLLNQENALEPENLAVRQRWSVSIPEGVRVVVGARLDRLSESGSKIMTTAAIIGRDFDFDLLVNLSQSQGASVDELHEALDEGRAANLIEELPGPAIGYRFTHSVIQQTLVDEHSTLGRMRVHALIAETILKLYETDLEAHAADLAYHLSEAGSQADSEELTRHALIAGEQALNSYAYEEAIVIFETALARKEASQVDDQLALLYHGLGRSYAAVLDGPAAKENLTRAFDIYVDSNQPDQAIGVACSPVSGLQTGVKELVARAMGLAQPNSHEAGHLLSHHGSHLGNAGDYEEAVRAFDEALSIAQRENDVELEMWTQARAGRMEIGAYNYERCVERDGRAIELNRQIQDPRLESHAGMCLAYSLQGQGDLKNARGECESMLSVAEHARHRQGIVTALEINALLQISEGDWDGARKFLDRSISLAPNRVNGHAYRLLVEYSTGDSKQAEIHLERLLSIYDSAPGWHVPQFVLAHIGQITSQSQLLKAAKQAALKEVSDNPQGESLDARLTLGLVAIAEDDRASARELYSQLARFPESMRSLYFLTVSRVRGLLAGILEEIDQAAIHFEDAIEYSRRVGYWPELAWACTNYLELLLNRDAQGDHARASTLLDEALATAEKVDMSTLIHRLTGHKERLEAQNSAEKPTYPDGLTDREVEVLRLIATGQSNQQIADELFLSRYTIIRHVANIFGKTGCANRVEATGYVHDNNLLLDSI
jgi:DNA-binding CsgD family transcriptional regulator